MVGIIVILLFVFIGITYFIIKNRSKKTPNNFQNMSYVNLKNEKNIAIRSDDQEKVIYKKKGIKTFDLKGMFYQNLNIETHSGEFFGFVKCEPNSHDIYAVGVYNNQNELLGFIPKGNKRLSNSLNEWSKGKVLAWGGVSYDNFEKKWYGSVNIPVGFTYKQIEIFEKAWNLIDENKVKINSKEISVDKYLEILNTHQQIRELLSDLKNPKEFYYSFPKNLIPKISKHLEKEQNWVGLIELEKHQDLILELSEKFKKATLKRINNAKKKI